MYYLAITKCCFKSLTFPRRFFNLHYNVGGEKIRFRRTNLDLDRPKKIDSVLKQNLELQKDKTIITKVTKMNTDKKTRMFCCSVCGGVGHNKNNTKFHSDYNLECNNDNKKVDEVIDNKYQERYAKWAIEGDEETGYDNALTQYFYSNESESSANKFFKDCVINSALGRDSGYGITLIAVRLRKYEDNNNDDGIIISEWKKGGKIINYPTK